MRLLIPIIIVSILASCSQSQVPAVLQEEVDSLVLKWVPDSREGICNLNLSMLSDGKLLIKGETNLSGARDEIINHILKSGFKLSDSLIIIPDTTEIKKTWGLVTISVSNIKKSPSHSSELVSQAIMGTPVKILKKKGGWLMIQTPDYYIGWENSSGIADLNGEQISKWKQSDRVIYLKNSGNIYSELNNNEIISDIVLCSLVVKSGEDGRYFHIVLPDGRKGLVNKSDVKGFKDWCTGINPEVSNLVSVSKTMLGSPYLWGGTSTKAVDCSGFIKTIYFINGIILARDASLQFLHGTPIDFTTSFELLNTGDLIFFGSDNNGKKKITHVGMYIGNTEVINSSGMVRINSLDPTRANYSEYLKSGLIGVRRIIGTESKKGTERIKNHNWYF
jgi:gamma-D-glutamyl-L-lysine dipeptidyl-peptidase